MGALTLNHTFATPGGVHHQRTAAAQQPANLPLSSAPMKGKQPSTSRKPLTAFNALKSTKAPSTGASPEELQSAMRRLVRPDSPPQQHPLELPQALQPGGQAQQTPHGGPSEQTQSTPQQQKAAVQQNESTSQQQQQQRKMSDRQPTRPDCLDALRKSGPSLGAQQLRQQTTSLMQPVTSSTPGSPVGAPLRGVPCDAPGQVTPLQGNVVGPRGQAGGQSALRQAPSQLHTAYGPVDHESRGVDSGLKAVTSPCDDDVHAVEASTDEGLNNKPRKPAFVLRPARQQAPPSAAETTAGLMLGGKRKALQHCMPCQQSDRQPEIVQVGSPPGAYQPSRRLGPLAADAAGAISADHQSTDACNGRTSGLAAGLPSHAGTAVFVDNTPPGAHCSTQAVVPHQAGPPHAAPLPRATCCRWTTS